MDKRVNQKLKRWHQKQNNANAYMMGVSLNYRLPRHSIDIIKTDGIIGNTVSTLPV